MRLPNVFGRHISFGPKYTEDEEVLERMAAFVREYGIASCDPYSSSRSVFPLKKDAYAPFGSMNNWEGFTDDRGDALYISQPFFLVPYMASRLEGIESDLRAFASAYGAVFERRDDLSYIQPGRTTMLVWRFLR